MSKITCEYAPRAYFIYVREDFTCCFSHEDAVHRTPDRKCANNMHASS